MFKHSAFIENTPDMREWLESIGYELFKQGHVNENILYTEKNGIYFTSILGFNSLFPKMVDCRSNPQLFKAITAMREDSDVFQWFTDGKYWFYSLSDDFKNFGRIRPKGATNVMDSKDFHKATLEELKEHFK